jgi:hypothetical protein
MLDEVSQMKQEFALESEEQIQKLFLLLLLGTILKSTMETIFARVIPFHSMVTIIVFA